MRNDKEYHIYKQLAQWLAAQHPKLVYRFDQAGYNLSMPQATKNKAIQCGVAYPDFFLAKPSRGYSGLYIEIKPDGFEPFQKRDKTKFVTEHVKDQSDCLGRLMDAGYAAKFGMGFEQCKKIIINYLNE